MRPVRRVLRDLALLFFAAVGAYVLSVLVSARAAMLWSRAAPSSPWLGLALGMAADDLGKLPGLLLGVWTLASLTNLSPLSLSLGLVACTHALDHGITALLLPDKLAIWLTPPVLLARLAVAAAAVWALCRLATWRRRQAP